MKILVFGGTGFLGFHVVKNIFVKYPNAEVVVYHRATSNLKFLQELGCPLKYVKTDFSESDLAAIESADVIINCIGETSFSPIHRQRSYDVNVTLAVAIAKLALRLKARLVHTSSQAAYGFHSFKIDETVESNAFKTGLKYAETKFLGEQKIKELVKAEGLQAVVLSPAIVIGSHDSHNWSKVFIQMHAGTIPGIPNNQGTFACANEVGKAHVTAIEKGRVGESYLLGGPDHRFREYFNKVSVLLEVDKYLMIIPTLALKLYGRFNDVKTFFTRKAQDISYEDAILITSKLTVSSKKAVAELGYNDKISLDEMLLNSFQWLKGEGYFSQKKEPAKKAG